MNTIRKNFLKLKLNFLLLLKYLLIFISYLTASYSYADWQHRNSLLIGERASGMGGAYTAISNDPSGIYYNPGGIAFSKDTEINLSVAGYYFENIKVNSIYGISNYQYEIKNSDIINGFLGFTKKLKFFDEEFFFGFAVYIPDNTNINTKLYFYSPSSTKNLPVKLFITNNREIGKESNYQISLSKLINNNLGIGISLGIFNIEHDELSTDNFQIGPLSDVNYTYYYGFYNVYDNSYYIRGVDLCLGTIYKIFEKISTGFSVNFKFPILQNYTEHSNLSNILLDSNGVPYTSIF